MPEPDYIYLKPTLEITFIIAKRFVEQDLTRKEAAHTEGYSRPWTYKRFDKLAEVIEKPLEDIEGEERREIAKEIKEWFSKKDRKERFFNKIEKTGPRLCDKCGNFYSIKGKWKNEEYCEPCYNLLNYKGR